MPLGAAPAPPPVSSSIDGHSELGTLRARAWEPPGCSVLQAPHLPMPFSTAPPLQPSFSSYAVPSEPLPLQRSHESSLFSTPVEQMLAHPDSSEATSQADRIRQGLLASAASLGLCLLEPLPRDPRTQWEPRRVLDATDEFLPGGASATPMRHRGDRQKRGEQTAEQTPKRKRARPSGASASTTEMPKATEEDWNRRQDHRQAGVAAVKRSSAYQNFAARRRHGEVWGPSAPQTPDPIDQSTSKRTWESKMQQWRRDLTRYELDDPIEEEWIVLE